MNILIDPVYWAVAGGILMLAELIVPGGIVFFLGAACLTVAGALWLGLIMTWDASLILFFMASLALIFLLRSLFSRFVEGDFTVANTEEILDDVDQVVSVIETIGPGQQAGAVNFRGIRWRALSDGARISVGEKVKIVARENTTIIVIPLATQESLRT